MTATQLRYEAPPSPGIQGWMGDPELQWLFEQASQMTSIVEIGSWRGRSTHALLSGCYGHVWAVDHFQGSRAELGSCHADAATHDIQAELRENLKEFGECLHVIPLESGEAALLFGEREFDMVFIDGSHKEEDVYRDLELWAPKARLLVCGHDWNLDGVTPACLKYFGKEPLERYHSLWSYPMAPAGWLGKSAEEVAMECPSRGGSV